MQWREYEQHYKPADDHHTGNPSGNDPIHHYVFPHFGWTNTDPYQHCNARGPVAADPLTRCGRVTLYSVMGTKVGGGWPQIKTTHTRGKREPPVKPQTTINTTRSITSKWHTITPNLLN